MARFLSLRVAHGMFAGVEDKREHICIHTSH